MHEREIDLKQSADDDNEFPFSESLWNEIFEHDLSDVPDRAKATSGQSQKRSTTELLADLGSEDAEIRRAGEQALIQRGLTSASTCVGGLDHVDPEVRRRCAKVLTHVMGEALVGLNRYQCEDFLGNATEQIDDRMTRANQRRVANVLSKFDFSVLPKSLRDHVDESVSKYFHSDIVVSPATINEWRSDLSPSQRYLLNLYLLQHYSFRWRSPDSSD